MRLIAMYVSIKNNFIKLSLFGFVGIRTIHFLSAFRVYGYTYMYENANFENMLTISVDAWFNWTNVGMKIARKFLRSISKKNVIHDEI